jgi:hypothetical protein
MSCQPFLIHDRNLHTLARVLILSAMVAFSAVVKAQDTGVREIKIPYALSWGDTPEKIRDMISAVKAHETADSEKSPGKVVIEAEGLGVGDPLLKKSLFTFRDGSLVEVELQYVDETWDGDKAIDFFDRTRRRIDERYGAGILMVNRVKDHPADDPTIPEDLNYTMIVYHWTQSMVALELNFYSMEEKERAFRIVSLHYKTP